MTTRREARASILWACLLGVAPALGWAQTREPIPEGSDWVFFRPALWIAIPYLIVGLGLVAYAYHKGRLTSMRVIATTLALMGLWAVAWLAWRA
jgi:hypothetical protein